MFSSSKSWTSGKVMRHLNIVVDDGCLWSQMAEIHWPRLIVRVISHPEKSGSLSFFGWGRCWVISKDSNRWSEGHDEHAWPFIWPVRQWCSVCLFDLWIIKVVIASPSIWTIRPIQYCTLDCDFCLFCHALFVSGFVSTVALCITGSRCAILGQSCLHNDWHKLWSW